MPRSGSYFPRLVALALLLFGSTTASAQSSQNVTFLSRQDLYAGYAACWGWTGPSGQEYALLATTNGTSIVDVTTPTLPVELAFIPGPNSINREIKSYDHFAYIVSEGADSGLQIVDLLDSPPSLVNTFSATFTTGHTITIAGSYAYVSGARNSGTQVGLRILSLADPKNPVDVGFWNDFYTHDCQVRGDTLWAACINARRIAVVNITNRSAPTTIQTFTWTNNFTHNCDLTTDGRYLLTTDENAGGHLHIFDVGDVSNVQLVAEWTANPAAIIHNVHVLGNLAYVAYYTEGVRVVDITYPQYPVEVGWYDTYPGVSGGFNGCWEAYPYAPTKNVYVSDRDNGLYVLRYEPTAGSVSGYVSDATSGLPLHLAPVSLAGGPSTFSNPVGFYRLFHLPGAQSLGADVFGYEPHAAGVTLSLVMDTRHDIPLVRRPGAAVTGTVRDAVSSLGLAGASLSLDDTPAFAATNGSGDYDFANVPYGVYRLTASRFGYLPRSHSLTISTGPQQVDLDFDLTPVTAVAAHDFEAGMASGWTRVDLVPVASAEGRWLWADPVGSASGAVQPENDHSLDPGHFCWVTGNATSPIDPIDAADVDNGRTALQSPVFSMAGFANAMVSYWRWYSNDSGANPGTDTLHVQISNDAGSTWHVLEDVLESTHRWTEVRLRVAEFVAPTAAMRVRVIAEDLGGASTVEAAFDDFMAYDTPTPTATPPPTARTALYSIAPNPANPEVRIDFELGESGYANLEIYDARGRLVRGLLRGEFSPGRRTARWDGRDDAGRAVSSGAYWVRLRATDFERSGSIRLVR